MHGDGHTLKKAHAGKLAARIEQPPFPTSNQEVLCMSFWTAVLAALRRRVAARQDQSRQQQATPRPLRPVPAVARAPIALSQPVPEPQDAMPAQVSDRDNRTTSLALPILDLGKDAARAAALEADLGRLHGIMRAYVSPFTGLAYIDYDAEQITEERLLEAVTNAGWTIDMQAKRFAWRRY